MRVCITVPPIIPDHIPYKNRENTPIHLLQILFFPMCVILFMSNVNKRMISIEVDIYLSTQVELKAKNTTQRNSNHVITSNIDVCDKRLPSTPNSHPFK